MEKLSKEELQKQLADIEKQKAELKDELFYQHFKDLTFFETIKELIRWKNLLIICLVVFIGSLFDTGTVRYVIMFGFNAIIILAALSYPIENYQRIKRMKKNREANEIK